ncbi:MAG: iron-sulfur cluster assembly accessory protein [Candidatus Competibacteraceae bacterium]|uniref:Regulator believed to be involved in Fe-S cluster assembly and activation n=1 Tax=Candidatus Contendobacter odensis Run_B_J11 TaxID=1400861 RepID=A0A7U7GGE7_9GAMM|nr:iron-sulfur cluster assembly accessory protein [Candidatus Contendobacter odensis]MBK8537920.1 iron-sulfur cluster assembly accessory protein [Candidatus Competibacteraceae bacterium]MBK8750174.1 iron-sulfur cluster assembly accessory protein [Candidatus Competibacteraceae bacterium]CDH47433.1 putative regulator believed to be involved in Fe-S cluster assembly and activation [Candidatus Contendobacter odensis Run_B_J11]
MSITLTEKAANRALSYLAKKEQAQGLRLGVRNTGCSGYMYVVGLADTIEADDQIFESQGVKVVISTKNLPYLDGIELDYTKEGLNEGFRFRNPNVKDSCGCGESFSV